MGRVPYHRNNLGTAIAQRARDRLEEQSTEQLSLRQIAQDLGVSSAAIYRHFPDKAALLANVSQTVILEVSDTLRQGVLDSPDAATMLRQVVDNLMGYAQLHPQLMTLCLRTDWPAPKSLSTVIALYATQLGLHTTPALLTRKVWTYLLGVLCQPQRPVPVATIVTDLTTLLGGSAG